MSDAVNDVRAKIQAVEVALQGGGSNMRLVNPTARDAGIDLAHHAILDCLKAMAETLERIEKKLRD